jgi:hypothetical protein
VVILTVGAILDELKQLKYEVQQIVRDEITTLLKGQVSSNITLFNSTVSNPQNGERLSETQMQNLHVITREIARDTLTLKNYRYGQGYGHWAGIAAGSLFYIAASKIIGTGKGEVEGNLSSIKTWFDEAIDPQVEGSLAAVAASLADRAAETKSRLESERGPYLIAFTTTNRGRHLPEPITYYHYSLLSIAGSIEAGFVGSLNHGESSEWPHVPYWRGNAPHRGNSNDRLHEIMGTIAAERATHFENLDGEAGLKEHIAGVAEVTKRIDDLLAGYEA